MRKLFLYDTCRSDPYTKQLDLAYELVKEKSDTKRSNIDKIDQSLLKNFDVIISNSLPKDYEFFAKKEKIILIYIESYQKKNKSDLLIDFKYKKTTDDFTGKKYQLFKNKKAKFQFELLFNIVIMLEWDSSFWGFPISLITTRKLTASIIFRVNLFVKKNSIKLIQYLCNCHDRKSVNYAESNKYNFKDIRLTFEKSLNLKSSQDRSHHQKFKKATMKEFIDLKRISKSIYKDSRYYFDTTFNIKKVQEFYDQWLYKAINNLYDNECLIYSVKEKPVAYCTLRYLNQETAVIGLLGVGKKFSGKGYGKKLMNEVYYFLNVKGIKKVLVVTQGRNFKAQRFYQREGFLTENTELWYHKWI